MTAPIRHAPDESELSTLAERTLTEYRNGDEFLTTKTLSPKTGSNLEFRACFFQNQDSNLLSHSVGLGRQFSLFTHFLAVW